jgi:hypothetical protein
MFNLHWLVIAPPVFRESFARILEMMREGKGRGGGNGFRANYKEKTGSLEEDDISRIRAGLFRYFLFFFSFSSSSLGI